MLICGVILHSIVALLLHLPLKLNTGAGFQSCTYFHLHRYEELRYWYDCLCYEEELRQYHDYIAAIEEIEDKRHHEVFV